MKQIFLFFLILISNVKLSQAQLVDIDGNVYKTVKIGNQTWMAENLEVSRFRNGDLIPLAKSHEEFERFGKEKTPAKLIDRDSSNKNIMTQYNWYAVKDERGLAPFGWRIPSLEDIYKIRDEKKNELVHLLNKNNKSKKDRSGWWTSDYAMEDGMGRGILEIGGHIIHSSGNFIHTNERYLPESAFNVICIKE